MQALRAFSQVSRKIREATAWALHGTLSIRFVGLSDLQDVVAQISETGLGRHFLFQARRLNIIGVPDHRRRTGNAYGPDESIAIEDFIPYSFGSFMERFMSDFDLPGYDLRHRDEPHNYYLQADWRPLVFLVSHLPKLTSIHYAVANPFPPDLFHAVSRCRPECEIYIWCHQTPYLNIPHIGPIHSQHNRVNTVHWHEQLDAEILYSSQLRAIRLNYPTPEGGSLAGAIPYILRAPKLQHVHLRLHCVWRGPEGPIKDISWNTSDGFQPVDLQSFSLPPSFVADSALSQWTPAMNLSTLKSLHLSEVRDPSHLERVASKLESLERLSIGGLEEIPTAINPLRDFKTHLRSIFRQLKPLKYLSLRGLEDIMLLHGILEHHGPSLLGLMLPPGRRSFFGHYLGPAYPFVDHNHLRRIAQHCPKLKDLRVPIHRSKGDRAEVLLYRALGSFPNLRNLILDLYGNPRPVLSAENGTFSDNVSMRVSLRDALINFATDTTLATAIWTEISSHQPSRKLIRLRVSPWGHDAYFGEERFAILQIARSFLVTYGGSNVVEIGETERNIEIDELLRRLSTARNLRLSHLTNALQTLHSIWQPPPDYTGAYSDYRSFPLQTNGV